MIKMSKHLLNVSFNIKANTKHSTLSVCPQETQAEGIHIGYTYKVICNSNSFSHDIVSLFSIHKLGR